MSASWSKGIHSEYTAFVMEIHVRKDQETGTLQSFRRLQDTTDVKAAESLGPTGGIPEGSWALLTESVRSEAMLQLLRKLSNDPKFKGKLEDAEGSPEDLVENLSKSTLQQVQRGLEELVLPLAREAITAVQNGLRNQAE